MFIKYSKVALFTALTLNILSPLYATAFDPADGETQLVYSGHSLPPVSGDRKQLVVLLHGLTGKADDMLGVAGVWRHVLPNAEFLIPTAKDNSWFPIMDYLNPDSSKKLFLGASALAANHFAGYCGSMPSTADVAYQLADSNMPEEVLLRVRGATTSMNRFLDRALQERQLSDQNLFLAGFSQGSIMAMTTALHRNNACAGVLGVAGVVLSKNEHLKSRPPVCMIHGTHDTVVPHIAMLYSAKKLSDFSVPVESHSVQNLGHEFNQEVVDRGSDFLRRFSGNTPPLSQWQMPALPTLNDLSPDGTLTFMLQVGRLIQECPPEHKLALLGNLKATVEQTGFSLPQAIEHSANVLVQKQIPGALEIQQYVMANKMGGIEAILPELITRALALMGPSLSNELSDHEAKGYLALNPDLRAAFGNDLENAKKHWKTFGQNEGRRYDQLTDSEARQYLSSYDDLRLAFGDNVESAKKHWKEHGMNEGRHL